MTYFGFLLRFLVIPIAILLVINSVQKDRPLPGFVKRLVWTGILVHVFLAVLYTTPWDNYLVATGVWYYNPDLVTGILLGYVPIEEYTFFVLETLLAGLWWVFLARNFSQAHDKGFNPSLKMRWGAFGTLFVIWILFSTLFFFGSDAWNYLGIIFFWAIPAIFPQILFGADILWYHRKLVLPAIFIPGAYLSLIDIVAIIDTTWTISPEQTTGVLLFGVLPVEEIVFFFITNLLIVFGLTLMLSEIGQGRLRDWTKKFNARMAKYGKLETI